MWDKSAAPITDPITALQSLAGRLEHSATVLGAQLDAGDMSNGASIAWLRILSELRQVLVGLERLDLDARQIELEAGQAAKVTAAWREVMALQVIALLPPADRDLMLRTFLVGLGVDVSALEDRTAPPRRIVVRGEVGE